MSIGILVVRIKTTIRKRRKTIGHRVLSVENAVPKLEIQL